MNYLKSYLTILALFVIALSLQAGEKATPTEKSKTGEKAATEGVDWLSYPEALEKSQKEGVHVFIDFSRKGCGWCRKMENETYTDAAVIKMLNEHYAPTKVRGDSNEELDIDGYKITERALSMQEFGVTSYPQFWFLTPNNAKVGPLRGYLPTDRFMKALDYVREFKYDTTRVQEEPAKDSAKQ